MLAFYLSMIDNEEDKLTLTRIYKKLSQRCYHIAKYITKDSGLAEDAVHDAFMSVIKHKDKILKMPCEKRTSLIVIIVKNKAIDIIRKQSIRTGVPFDDDYTEITQHHPDVSKLVEDDEMYSYLLKCIASLPEKYKVVAEMRYVLELNNQEIAELIGIKPQNVSMRINRARLMLQAMLEKKG